MFDKYGGFQLYVIERDVELSPLRANAAERTYPSEITGASASVTAGYIYGTDIEQYGTTAYEGPAIDLIAGPYDHYEAFSVQSGTTDNTRVGGDDFSIIGFGNAFGRVAINARPWLNMPRIGPQIP